MPSAATQISVTPTSGARPITFRATGSGFTPGGSASCRAVNLSTGALLAAGNVVASAQGAMTCSLTISLSAPAGAIDFYAIDNRTERSSNHVTVTVQ
jgi:hypothetical protein